MNVLARVLFLALSVALVTAAPAGATHSRGKCTAHGETLEKNDSGRVYETTDSEGVDTLWGCLWSRNKPVELDTAAGDDYVTIDDYSYVVLRGRYVAWIHSSGDISCKADCPPGYGGVSEYVHVFDLKRRRGETTFTHPVYDGLRLNTFGAVAWLTREDQGVTVNAWTRAETHRVLDQGAIRRFRLRGTELSWLNGDAPHSATLR
jgi:hypothetical protein